MWTKKKKYSHKYLMVKQELHYDTNMKLRLVFIGMGKIDNKMLEEKAEYKTIYLIWSQFYFLNTLYNV